MAFTCEITLEFTHQDEQYVSTTRATHNAKTNKLDISTVYIVVPYDYTRTADVHVVVNDGFTITPAKYRGWLTRLPRVSQNLSEQLAKQNNESTCEEALFATDPFISAYNIHNKICDSLDL